MSALSGLNPIEQNTTADALEVDANYNLIADYINTQVIRSDGGIAMENPLLLNGDDPSEDNQAANKGYVDQLIPVGTILPFAGTASPGPDWHICNGAELASSTYPKLHALIGTTAIYGDATPGNFKLPDLRGRIPIGSASGSTGGRFALGRTAGSWQVPVPSHTHEIDHDHAAFDSGNEDTNHYHKLVHTHTINHNHPLETMNTSLAGNHDHTVRTRTGPIPATGPVHFVVEGSDANFNGTGEIANGGIDSGAHQHSMNVDLDVTVGLVSGAASEDTTTGQLDSAGAAAVHHQHSINVPAFNGDSKAYEKEITYDIAAEPDLKSTTELIPPHVSINFIIKLG